MKKYFKKVAIYIMIGTLAIGTVNIMPTASVTGAEFNGDIVTNPWEELFTDGATDPGDLDIGNSGNEDKNNQETTKNQNTTNNDNADLTKIKKVLKTKVVIAKRTNKKKAKIRLKKIKQAAGYQIKYSTTKKFKKAKTTKKIYKKNKFTIKKLKAGKKYYIKARAYAKVNGKRVYGAWSKKKKIKR